jgi:hypothetical protein
MSTSTKLSRTKSGQSAIARMATQSLDFVKDTAGKARKRYSGKKGASNIAKDIIMLKNLLNVEQKHVDTLTGPLTVVNGTSQVTALGTVGQGSTSAQRTGDSVKVCRVDMQLRFQYTSGTTNTREDQTFKYWLVRYLKTPISAGTSPFGINEFLNQDWNGDYSTSSFHNPDNMQNFDILALGQLYLPLQFNVATGSSAVRVVELSVDCDFHQIYNGTTGSTICENMLFLVLVGTQTVNAGGASEVVVGSRVWYLDN